MVIAVPQDYGLDGVGEAQETRFKPFALEGLRLRMLSHWGPVLDEYPERESSAALFDFVGIETDARANGVKLSFFKSA